MVYLILIENSTKYNRKLMTAENGIPNILIENSTKYNRKLMTAEKGIPNTDREFYKI
jgi:hypothetical protein